MRKLFIFVTTPWLLITFKRTAMELIRNHVYKYQKFNIVFIPTESALASLYKGKIYFPVYSRAYIAEVRTQLKGELYGYTLIVTEEFIKEYDKCLDYICDKFEKKI